MGLYTIFRHTQMYLHPPRAIKFQLLPQEQFLKHQGCHFTPGTVFFCKNLINESHTRKLVIDIHSYMQLFIQGNELFIYGFVHTRKWLVHARTWVIHIQGNELFIYKEMSYSYKEMSYSYMELFIQGNELFIYLYRTTCVCIYVW